MKPDGSGERAGHGARDGVEEGTARLPPPSGEAGLRRALRRNRLLASGLLAVAAAIFFVTAAMPVPGFWLSLVHAGAEAAVVGGLADWFAVTALFRRPLGLPIPRTAVVPKNKDRIGEGLGRFVESNFLAPEILASKLEALAPARTIAQWLGASEHARMVAEKIVEALPPVLRSLEDPQLREFAARSFQEQLREVEFAPILGRLLVLLTRSGQYDALFERALDAAQQALAENAHRFYAMVAERSRWWVPKAIDRHIAEKIIDGLEEVIAELRRPESGARRHLQAMLENMASELVVSPLWRQRVAEMKDRLLEQKEVQAWLGAIWDSLRGVVLADLAAPASRTREALATGLASLGRTLAGDHDMQKRFDAAIQHLALAVVPWRGQIAALIAEVVRGWDATTVANRLELAVGSDLQYIRMNGTLVGACVGCALFLISRLAF